MPNDLAQLLGNIRACRHCADALPCGPRPVLQAHGSARLRIVGQAPGRKVHETGIPWSDASGNRLHDWLGLTPRQFHDPRKVAIVPMGFCYPGKAPSGDAMFLLGSITKPICVTALMTLFDRGDFALDDPLRKFLPAFKADGTLPDLPPDGGGL